VAGRQALDRNVFAERLPGRNYGVSIASSPFQRFQFDPRTHFSRWMFAVFRVTVAVLHTFDAGLRTEVAHLRASGRWGSWIDFSISQLGLSSVECFQGMWVGFFLDFPCFFLFRGR